MGGVDDTQALQISSLVDRIKELEVNLRRKEASETELQKRNKKLEDRCKDLETSMTAIQPKYQEALNERGESEFEFTKIVALNSRLRKEVDAKTAEITKAQHQKALDDAELTDIRAQLSASSIPEIATIANMQDEVRAIKTENERLQRKVDSVKKDADFARNQYQIASTSAGEAAREISALEQERNALQAKDHENAIRVHEIYNSSEVQQLLDRVNSLKAENEMLEADLEKKNEELKGLMNGRRGTRGVSVPRSPRLGNANMSPGPQRAIGRVMASTGNRSRGNSPAPGEARGQFGEALFQGPTRQWGNHLQG